MGVVIRMNMAVGLGRAEQSWAQAVVRNRCQLTHICRACWDTGVSGHGSDHLRDTVHLGPERSLAFALGSQCLLKARSLSPSLSLCLSLPARSSAMRAHTYAHMHRWAHSCLVQIQIFLAQRTSSDSDLEIKGFGQPTLLDCDPHWESLGMMDCKHSLLQHCGWKGNWMKPWQQTVKYLTISIQHLCVYKISTSFSHLWPRLSSQEAERQLPFLHWSAHTMRWIYCM